MPSNGVEGHRGVKTPSKRPYLIRALYDWIVDSQLTPYLLVAVADDRVVVPRQHVQDGRIVLNVGPGAVRDLHIGDDAVSFDARFSGTAFAVHVPVASVVAIYARETGEGMIFEAEESELPAADAAASDEGGNGPPKGPRLTVIK